MKIVMLAIYVFTCLQGISQTDTLIIDSYKLALKKTKPFYNYDQHDRVIMPSEYMRPSAKEYIVNYKYFNQVEYFSETTNDGVQVLIKELSDTTDICKSGSMKFVNVCDSFSIKSSYFNTIRPMIKSQKNIYYLCYAKLYRLHQDTLVTCSFQSPEQVLDMDLSIEFNPGASLKNNLYVLTEIYYKEGLTTYYLDASFVITIN